MSNITTLAALREPQPQPIANVQAGFFDLQSFELMQRIAKGFSSSTLVPKEYQGNVANTMIALSMAQRIGADPLMVMQSLFIVHGRPSWSSKFLIATFNACGRFTSMRFRFQGTEGQDDWGCQAYATERATGNEIEGAWVTIKMAKAEGWYSKNGSKWQTMPGVMLRYRAASFMVNANAPELSLGLRTVEEAGDIIDVARQDDGGYAVTVDTLREPTPPASEPPAATPDWPQPNADGELVDVRGIPWIELAHSANKTTNADGTWRMKRGADAERVRQLEEEALAVSHPEVPSEPAEDPKGGEFERIKTGLATAADQQAIDEWFDYAREVVISKTQREELERVAIARQGQFGE